MNILTTIKIGIPDEQAILTLDLLVPHVMLSQNRMPRLVGVMYVNTYSRTQLYLFFKYTGVYNDMFRPYMWANIRLWSDLTAEAILECIKWSWRGFEISLCHGVPWYRVYLFGYRFSPIGIIFYARGYNIIYKYNYLGYNMYSR